MKTTKKQPLKLPENSEQLKNLILGGELHLAEAIATKDDFLYAFGLAISSCFCPLIRELWAMIKKPERTTAVERRKLHAEIVLLGHIRAYFNIWKTKDDEFCEVILPCQKNGFGFYDKFNFKILKTEDAYLEVGFFTRFMQKAKMNDKTVAQLWLDEFKIHLPNRQ